MSGDRLDAVFSMIKEVGTLIPKEQVPESVRDLPFFDLHGFRGDVGFTVKEGKIIYLCKAGHHRSYLEAKVEVIDYIEGSEGFDATLVTTLRWLAYHAKLNEKLPALKVACKQESDIWVDDFLVDMEEYCG